MANETKAAPAGGLAPEQLKDILTAVIAEVRKPPEPTPEQVAQIEQDKEMRRQQAELVKQEMENKRIIQETCSHMRRDGSTTAVYIQNGNYMICQACQKIIRPESEVVLFNRLLQLTTPAVF